METGQEIYLEPLGNAARRSKEIIPCTVSKIGRKYFETDNGLKFNKETMMHHNGQYATEYKAYESIEAVEDKQLNEKLFKVIQPFFNGFKSKLTTEQLQGIHDIIFF